MLSVDGSFQATGAAQVTAALDHPGFVRGVEQVPKLAEVATALAEAVAKAVAKAVAEVGGHSSEALAEGLAEVVAEVKAEALAALAELGCTLIHPPLSRSHALP